MTAPTSLKAMAADPGVNVKKTDLYKVDPRLLSEEAAFNLRDYDAPDVKEQIERFAEAFAAGRYIPPLIVRTDDDGRVLVVEGHLRRRGALLAIERGHDLPFVECTNFRGNDAERVEVMLRSAEGLQLKPLEIGLGYLRLSRKGYSNPDIAKAVGRTLARVEQLLLLANANTDVHALVRAGKVSADAAIDAVRQHGEAAGEVLEGLSTAQSGAKVTRQAVRGASIPPKVATHVNDAFTGFFGRGSSATLARLARWEKEGMRKGEKVEVDAAALHALKLAYDQMADMQAKRTERDAAKAARASQRDIEDDLGDEAAQG